MNGSIYIDVKDSKYRCADVRPMADGNGTWCGCGGAKLRDGKWWCTHIHGYYSPDYRSEICGNAIFDDGQITMEVRR